MAATGGNIECAGTWQDLNICKRRGDIRGVGQDMGFPVLRALAFELISRRFLDGIESHLVLFARFD
jgi:hypothetical protein